MSAKPKIAAFPKGWIRDLVAPDKLSIYEWIDMSQAMGIEGQLPAEDLQALENRIATLKPS